MHPLGEDEGGRAPGTVCGIVFAHHGPVAPCTGLERRGGTIVDRPGTLAAVIGTVTLGVVVDPVGNPFGLRHVRP